MPLNIYNLSPELYENGMNMLSERLRRNWMQKLDSTNIPDDSLTSLSWLYDMHPIGIEMDTTAKLCEVDSTTDSSSSACLVKFSSYGPHRFAGSLLDPKVRLEYRTKWTGKPPFSYATLICLAMRELGKPKVTLSDIYGWIMNNFAYYRHTDSSWQNSVRHNLSLNKCFEKVPRDKNERGKGGFWRVNPKHADWLEANLAKCRKAAPPPGPPPPMPRSMLLQQRQQQLQGTGLIVSCSTSSSCSAQLPTSVSLIHGITPETNTTISYSRFESPKWNTATALSPSSASSISSLSSSPQSMSSVPSPAGVPNNRLQAALTPYPHLVPISTTHMPNVYHENEYLNGGKTNLPSIQQNQWLGQTVAAQVPVRRRKSPLHTCASLDPTFSAIIDGVDEDRAGSSESSDYDDSTDCTRDAGTPDRAKISTDARARRRQAQLNEFFAHRLRNRVSKSQCESIVSKSEKSVRSGVNGAVEHSGTRSTSEEKQNLRKQAARERWKLINKRSVSTNRIRSESTLVPTRVMPPRHRYSRWSRPRTEQGQSVRSSPTRTPQRGCLRKRQSLSESEHTQDKTDIKLQQHRYPYLPCLEENGDDNDNVWPPFCHNTIKKSHSPSTSSNSNTRQLCIGEPRLQRSKLTAESSSLTPPYVPAGLVPCRSGGGVGAGSGTRDSSSSAASSCSMGSAFSNLSGSVHGSDGHLYHSVQTHAVQRTPTKVETQISQLIDPASKGLESAVQFSRLYPTTGEAESYLGTSPDRLRMPKWAAVFLPEGEDSELEPLFQADPQPTDHETMNFFNSLDTTGEDFLGISNQDRNNLSDTDELSVVSRNIQSHELDCMERVSDSPSVNTPSSGVYSESGTIESTRITKATEEEQPHSQSNFLAPSSPLLEEFELDSGGLDFDALSSLVEASGPIPLDLDLALTASFGGNYASYSNDSTLGSSDQELCDSHRQIKTSVVSPWSVASSNVTEGLNHSWFVDSINYSSTCCLGPALDDGCHPATHLTNTAGGRHANLPLRLNTPPS